MNPVSMISKSALHSKSQNKAVEDSGSKQLHSCMTKHSPAFPFHSHLPMLNCQCHCPPVLPNNWNTLQTFPAPLKYTRSNTIFHSNTDMQQKSTTVLKNEAAWKAQACCPLHFNFIPRIVRRWALDCSVLHNVFPMTSRAISRRKKSGTRFSGQEVVLTWQEERLF